MKTQSKHFFISTLIGLLALCGGAAQAKDVQVTAGDFFTCAWVKNLSAKCWGLNTQGQLGQGSNVATIGSAANQMGNNLAPINFGTGRSATTIVAGSFHACALLDNNQIKCWGNNQSGELGLGDATLRGLLATDMGDGLPAVDLGSDANGVAYTAKRITAGAAHSCALLSNNQVKCWGNNNYGQLGQSDMNPRGDGIGLMGNDLKPVDLGTNPVTTLPYGAKEIGALGYQTCAKLDNDDLKCWGNNSHGQLGQGDLNNMGDVASEMGGNLSRVKLGGGRIATKTAGGAYHLCALLNDATIKCWGWNFDGQLGLGTVDTSDRGDAPMEMANNLLAINLGTGLAALDVAAAGSHSCALLGNNLVKCWGANASGQLGQGDKVSRGVALNDMGDALLTIDLGTGRTAKRIAAGLGHSCAVLDRQELKCWGLNQYGQLGLGDVNTRGDGAGEMGDALPVIDLGTF
jgi:alpha-tubulin suppressor-like RCC1 family protein